jgi:hypothetical protein
MDTTEKMKVLKKDAVINIPVSTNFHLRMLQVAAYLTETKTPEEITEINKQLADENVTDPFVASLQTIYIFCNTFKNEALEQNAFEEKTKEEYDEYIKTLMQEDLSSD